MKRGASSTTIYPVESSGASWISQPPLGFVVHGTLSNRTTTGKDIHFEHDDDDDDDDG